MQVQQDEMKFCEHLKQGADAAIRKGYPGLAALFMELAEEIEQRQSRLMANYVKHAA